ncbi:MAG: 7-cyano-7-deazaguanine synthase [Deltaproteobacteria bacterium]|nr:7-cyano-7-deazaguanine synthase [Deltaproteobacteria bacterium]
MTSALLLSGGMDSISLAWKLRPEFAITIDYGQLPAQAEIQAADAVCTRLDIRHEVIRVNCRKLGMGDMSGLASCELAPASDWWPFRNQLLVTLAGMRCIALGVKCLYLGTVKSDEQHRDGTPEFIRSVSHLMSYQEGSLQVESPAISMSSAELVRWSGIPSSLLAWAHSCHTSNVACGQCRGCNKYFATFSELGYDLECAS